MADVVVIGGGVGGLAAAIRLRVAGHNVVVLEARRLGGKLGSIHVDGHTFDTGPSLLTLPDVFEDLFAFAGFQLTEFVGLIRLEHPFRHHFSDFSVLDVFDDPHTTRASFAELTSDGATTWDAMHRHSHKVWTTADRTFFQGEMSSPLSLAKRVHSPTDFWSIDAHRTLAQRSALLFTDQRLQAWLNRYATYSGSSPYETPATLSCIPYIEQRYGAWHVKGGLGQLVRALVQLAQRMGVELREDSLVRQVSTKADKVMGVTLDNEERISANIVVNNTNAETFYQDLFPHERSHAKALKAGRSSSVMAMCLGLSGESHGTTHHNLWYSSNQRLEFDEIFNGSGVATSPTIYACNPSGVDPSLAEPGHESWFVLVNVAAGASTDWEAYGDAVIERLGVSNRVRFRQTIVPADLESQYGDPGGAIYGTSSNGRRAAFLRASNRGAVDGLYLCGGSAHPGGGLPLVAMSGRIVAETIAKDGFS